MITYDMPRAAYDQIEAVNFSTLKAFAKSPAHYRHLLTTPREDTDAMRLGRAIHLAVLEPEKFRARCVRWQGGRRAGKEWEAFKAEFKTREILKDDEYSKCLAISAAARADIHAKKYLSGGKGEITAVWEQKGFKCRGRMDFVASCGAIVDLKSTRDASPQAFGSQAMRLAYHVQCAWYRDGYALATDWPQIPCVIVAVESSEPYCVQVYTLDEDTLELGAKTYRQWLDQLRVCREESRWPGYADGEMVLQLPRWAIPSDEDSAEDMGLTFSKGEADATEF